jgi:prepilin peptidase CpaA
MTALAPISARILLVVTAAVLFYAAWTDLREYKIRNELIGVLAGLCVLHALLSGRWVAFHWNVLIAFVMFLIMLVFYARNAIGGGDVKLLTVAFLWVGFDCAPPFTVLLLAFAIINWVVVKFGWMVMLENRRIAFGPAIAAALIGTFMLGCVEGPHRHVAPDIQLGTPRAGG